MKLRLLKDRNVAPKRYRAGEIIDTLEVGLSNALACRWVQKGMAVFINEYTDYPVSPDYIKHEPVSIVIPVFGALKYLERCIDSVVKYTQNFELIVIDNGSDKATKDYLKKSKKELGFILQINKENKGFSYACNQGIKLATCDYICFLNSDTQVTPYWLGKLMKGFSQPKAGIIGPSTCFSGGEQCIWKLAKSRLSMTEADINSINPGTGIKETEIYGFCYTVARKVIDDIGVFDVDRYPIGSAEEKDFSWRAHKAGYKSYWVKDSYVHHFGNQTFKEMGVIPGVIRKENDKAFEKRKLDKNIFIKNTVEVLRTPVPILTIVLDRLEYTKKAITSVLENTNYPFKLFIFNNGSDAKTTKYLESLKDKRIEMYHSRVNLGLVPAMNMFFDKFKDSRYIAKVDNDTVVPEGWLEKLIEVMEAYPLFTVQADHYLAMPFRIDSNEDFYRYLAKVDFTYGKIYLYKNSGGTGQVIRRSVIDKPLNSVKNKTKGGLSGWCNMQVQKYHEYPSAFYTGVWIDRLDQVYTNKYNEVSDYPEYDEMIKKMRPWGLGYARMNTEELGKIKKEMESWLKKNDCRVY